MNKKQEEKLSKFISKLLRHSGHEVGLEFDESGYCKIEDLLLYVNSQEYWNFVKEEHIEEVVKNCKKQRYTIESDKIKANYGHSFKTMTYFEAKPPKILLHGTSNENAKLILNSGIKKMNRSYVHLSEGSEFATLAGKRKGKLSILEVEAEKAFEDGVKFYYAGNEVWLCEFVDKKYVKID